MSILDEQTITQTLAQKQAIVKKRLGIRLKELLIRFKSEYEDIKLMVTNNQFGLTQAEVVAGLGTDLQSFTDLKGDIDSFIANYPSQI